MKFYAVAVGRNTGVYNTWDECQKEVNGFSGSKFKSFRSRLEALEWINKNFDDSEYSNKSLYFEPPQKKLKTDNSFHPFININRKMNNNNIYIDLTSPQKIKSTNSLTPYKSNVEKIDYTTCIDVYSDGSCQNGILKYGAFFSYNGKEYFLSGSFDEIKLENIGVPYSATINSPTAELLAVLCSLQSFLKVFSILSDKIYIHKINFYVDYIGIISWLDGSWKARLPHIKKLIELINLKIDALKSIFNIVVNFKKVPAHSGVYGNEIADSLAYDGEEKNSFLSFKFN